MIKIDFDFDTEYGVFRDAIHLNDDHGLTNEQIEELKQERLHNWLKHFEPPVNPLVE